MRTENFNLQDCDRKRMFQCFYKHFESRQFPKGKNVFTRAKVNASRFETRNTSDGSLYDRLSRQITSLQIIDNFSLPLVAAALFAAYNCAISARSRRITWRRVAFWCLCACLLRARHSRLILSLGPDDDFTRKLISGRGYVCHSFLNECTFAVNERQPALLRCT